jgi:hypothetical protein
MVGTLRLDFQMEHRMENRMEPAMVHQSVAVLLLDLVTGRLFLAST